MADKIQVTKEQAEMTEKMKRNRSAYLKLFVKDNGFKGFDREKLNGFNGFNNEKMNNFSINEFARLLYEPNSYEVIPEFNEDEWVVLTNGEIVRILIIKDTSFPENYTIKSNKMFAHNMGGNDWYDFNIIERHATQSEIEQEKQRIFWHRNGREVWELHVNDVISINDETDTVLDVNENVENDDDFYIELESDYLSKFGFKNLPHNTRLICFAEDRQDINL